MTELRLKYYGRVTDKIHIFRAKEMSEMIIKNFAGKDIQVTVEKKKKKRSLEQNAYYWGVVVPIVMNGLNEAGWKFDKQMTHDFLLSQFNIKEVVNTESGEIVKYIGRSSNMSTVEMMEYFMDITFWALEFLNIQIPLPNEQIELL